MWLMKSYNSAELKAKSCRGPITSSAFILISGAAKRAFTQADLERQTARVECRKDVGVPDEITGAYKSIEGVMKNQEDLVEVVVEIKQVVCVKG